MVDKHFKVPRQSLRRRRGPGEFELRLPARVSELEAELAAAIAQKGAAEADAVALRLALAAAQAGMQQGEHPPALVSLDDPLELRANAERVAAAQAAVARSEERFRLALAHSPVVVFTQDRALRYTWVHNPRHDFDPIAVLGKTDFDLLPHDDAAELTAIKRLAMETGAGQRTEARTTVGGQAYYYDLAVEPLRDASGHITGVACVTTDITERKRTERLLEQQAQQLAALHALSKAILGANSPSEIASAASRSLVEVTDARRAAVMLFDWDSNRRDILASHGLELESSRGRAPLEDYWLLDENRAGRTALIEDLEAYIPADGTRLRDEMLAGGIRSYAGIPLIIGADVIGALVLTFGQPGGFPAGALDFARQVADQLAVALHNARLFEQVQSHRHDLQTLSRRLVEVQEEERRALARDLHDTSGQAMTFINMALATLKRESGLSERARARIDELRVAADTVGEDLHRLSVNLRPASLDRYGLVPAIEDLINTMRKQAGIEVDFRVEGLDERLPDAMETALYRIIQEATTNITRHAAASHISVSVQRDEDSIHLEVEDNGRGFDVEAALNRGRLGLLGMRERYAPRGPSAAGRLRRG
jgi:PAS domain S-box-containing protein